MVTDLNKWLILLNTPHLGLAGIKKLWKKYGSIENIWNSNYEEWATIKGISQNIIKSFIENKKVTPQIFKLEQNIKIICLDNKNYPPLLKEIYDPPPILFVKGNIELLNNLAVAVVGTRKPSFYGMECAKNISYELSNYNITVVSGLAEGIDACAHIGALKGVGSTIAVLGYGFDHCFPYVNHELMQAIEKQGCLISEFLPSTPPSKYTFPKRNRIISGISKGTLVVEGARDSGSLITADFALEQGREVFAIPGNINHPQSDAPNNLIKQGAKMVTAIQDLLEEINPRLKTVAMNYTAKPKIDLPESEEVVLDQIRKGANNIEILAQQTRINIPDLLEIITSLEIKKLIKSLPGQNIQSL